MKRILVIGSLNIDLVTRAPRFPAPGETMAALSFERFFGGKGANQAAALARLGANAAIAGFTGTDAFGAEYRAYLEGLGVDCSLLRACGNATGTASITVDARTGDNNILIVPGANALFTPERLPEALCGPRADAALLQMEIPLDTVFAAARALHEKGTVVILDPAPAHPIPSDVLPSVDILTPNETELSLIAPADSFEGSLRSLISRGARCVIRKSGPDGAYIATPDGITHVPGFRVDAVDTTAAGDTFNAALACALMNGTALPGAVRFANAAAALSVTRPGAQAGMPTLAETLDLLSSQT